MDSMIYTPDRLTAPKVSSRFSRRPRFVVCALWLDCRVGGGVYPFQRHLIDINLNFFIILYSYNE